jgi:hypothetical protein
MRNVKKINSFSFLVSKPKWSEQSEAMEDISIEQ